MRPESAVFGPMLFRHSDNLLFLELLQAGLQLREEKLSGRSIPNSSQAAYVAVPDYRAS